MTEISQITSELNEALKDIKQSLSSLRKQGVDVTLTELKTFNIPSKIQLAEISKEDSDVSKVKQLLLEVKEEIDTIKLEVEAEMREKEMREKIDASAIELEIVDGTIKK
jgi:hypothetical protein